MVKKTRQLDPKKLGIESFFYVDISSVDKDTKRIFEPQTLLVDDAPSRARKEIKANDVLVATVRPNLNGVAIVPTEYDNQIASTGFCVLRSDTELLDPNYLFYFTQADYFISHLTELSTGAGYPAVSDEDILDTQIPLPPLTEQKRIASLLARADRLRQLRRTAHDLGDTLLQSVFLKMFGDLAHSKWEKYKLGKLIQGFEAGVNYLPVGEGENTSEWRVLKISAVTWGDFNPTESKAISADIEFEESHIVRQGDLLISRANTTELVGAVSLVKTIPPKVLLPDKLWRVKFKEDSKILPEYTLHALRQPDLRKIIGDLATGSSGSMKNISMEKATTLPIPVPPLSLQEEFASAVARRCTELVEVVGLLPPPLHFGGALRRGRMSPSGMISEAGRQALGRVYRDLEALFESLLAQSFDGG